MPWVLTWPVWSLGTRKFRYSVAVGGPGMQPWLGRRSKASPAALCVWFPCGCPAACPSEFSAPGQDRKTVEVAFPVSGGLEPGGGGYQLLRHVRILAIGSLVGF